MPMVIDRLGSSTVIDRQRARVVGVGEGVADRDLGEAGDGDDLAGPGSSAAATRSRASVM